MRVLFLLVTAMIIFSRCFPLSDPPPKLGVKDWKPAGIGGPVELRPLPPADKVLEDYRQWLESDSEVKARLYEATLVGASNQLNFSVKVVTGDTPLGQSVSTIVLFIYRTPAGEYKLYWSRRGRHNVEFLRLTDQPKTVWLQLNTVADVIGMPQFEIVAFEGLEPAGGVIALEGRKPK